MYKLFCRCLIVCVLSETCFLIFLQKNAYAQSNLPSCPPDITKVLWHNCVGTYVWYNAEKYVGEWQDHKQHGRGTKTFPDGRKYVGEWREGELSGNGTYWWPSGSKYVGEFQNSKRSGHGTFFAANGQKYVGEYRNDIENGQGTLTFPDGMQYTGGFLNRLFSGHGKFKFRDGKEYEGEFRNGEYNGLGTLRFQDGSNYVGEFRNNAYDGHGKLFAANGALQKEGYWISGSYFGANPPNAHKASGMLRVPMLYDGGAYRVPFVINDVLTIKFIVDSGATDVTIPIDIVRSLINTGTLTDSDFIGSNNYRLADGSVIVSKVFTLRSLKVGDRTIRDVRASVGSVNGPLLLGQSFLKKNKSWSIDNDRHELVIE